MPTLVIDEQGVLYRNPRPGYKAECAYLPNVVQLHSGELLCFYRLGQAFYSTGGRLAQLRSLDKGRTWQQDGLIWDPAGDDHPYSYSAPHGAQLGDGTLLVTARRTDAAGPDAVMFNPETGGAAPVDIVIFRSHDRGRNWLRPEVLSLPGNGYADAPSQIIELNDGRWFLACELWKAWDDSRPMHIKSFAVFSEDQGAT